MAARLSLQSVSKSFNGFPAVISVSFEIAPGEVFCLLGPSGCGKSTTLRLAAGLERADAGLITVNGAAVDDGCRYVPPEKRKVGLMFQDFALFPHLTVGENVAFGLNGFDRHLRMKIALEELEKVSLSRFSKSYPHELSGGEQQRVALARALAPSPSVMLMDEPFSGLDERLRETVRAETVRALKARGTAILIVTHDPEEALQIADRIAVMREGRIVQVGSPEDIYDRPRDPHVARFFSELNTVHAVAGQGSSDTLFGRVEPVQWPEGTRIEIMLRPQFLHLADLGDGIAGVVRDSRLLGDDCLIEVEVDRPDVTEAGEPLILKARVHGRHLPAPGSRVGVNADLSHAFVFPCSHQPERVPA